MKIILHIIPIIIVSFCMFSCVTPTGNTAKEIVSTPFKWSTEVGDLFTWQTELPKTQKYIITIRVNNNSDLEKNFNFYTDQGHFSRLSVPSIDKIYTCWIEYDLMLSGPVSFGIEDVEDGLEIISINIGNTYVLMDKPINVIPINSNASKEVVDLMSFLGKMSGKRVLSGQMDLTWDDSVNMELRVARFTGQKPGIMGFDFMNYKGTVDSGSGLKQVDEAIRYAEMGGIITFCWHWRVGDSNEFYADKTDFRINRDPESKEYKSMIIDIDQVAMELKKLADLNIPVLWRPIHEASNTCFWWGATGFEDYLFLWNLIYDRMTNYYGLNNLVWVWNGQSQAWYPGDNKIDIIGEDIYKGRGNHSSKIGEYAKAQSYVNGDELKLIAMTENGAIPDPQKLKDESVPWAWFMTWNDNNSNEPSDFFSGDEFTSHKNKKDFYNNPYMLNLEELEKM